MHERRVASRTQHTRVPDASASPEG
jgi:hypothetical protein